MACCLLLLVGMQAHAQDTTANKLIIPQPASMSIGKGTFTLNAETPIIGDPPRNKVYNYFTDYLKKLGFKNKLIYNVPENKVPDKGIFLLSKNIKDLPAYGYRLTITPDRITIEGKGAGIFYGMQTLMQLIPDGKATEIKIPCMTVEDHPRFAYRGMHLDVSRHFFPVEFIKKYLDVMAAYKLNYFHWHLTDDQGWRLEIKQYPKLTEIGSKRAQTLVGRQTGSGPYTYDGKPYDGFYTQDQVKDIVDYAAARSITIVPEIEMPGHCAAALAAYPELGCDPTKSRKVAEKWGGNTDVFCPSDTTFKFLQNVLTEVMALFPGKYIHIGGDEVDKSEWRASAYCQQLIRDSSLHDENGLQSYFIRRMERFINSKKRSIVGWDEILEGGLAPNATVMSWRGEQGGIQAAEQNHNVIMTPASGGLYFDHAQGLSPSEPLNIGGYAPLQKVYNYNPVPAALAPEQQKYIMGVQANLWTEYIPTTAQAEYMLLPRMLALAEMAWTLPENKSLKNFEEVRLPHHLLRLDEKGYNYRVPTPIGSNDTTMDGAKFTVAMKAPVEGSKIYFNVTGNPLTEKDIVYTDPINFTIGEGKQIDLQSMVVTKSGKRSVISHTTMNNIPPLESVLNDWYGSGVKYKMYKGPVKDIAKLDSIAVVDSGVAKGFTFDTVGRAAVAFGAMLNGYVWVDNEARYTFTVISDGTTQLKIDGYKIVNIAMPSGTVSATGAVTFLRGFHNINLRYSSPGGGKKLQLLYNKPGEQKTEIPAKILFN